MAFKYHIRVKLHEYCGCPTKDLCEEKKARMIEFLSRSDVAYTNPGRADVCMGKVDGKRKYSPRQYLLWTLNHLLVIINGTSELILESSSNFASSFSKKLNLCQIHDFT